MRSTRHLLLGMSFLLAPSARAEHTLYVIPGTELPILLDGKVKVNPCGTVTLRHPRGTLYFNARDIRILKTPTRPENVPRVSSKQQAIMKRYWGSSQTDTSIHDYALASAPPPYDSSLQQGITEILNRDPSSEKTSSAFSSQRLALKQIDARWQTIREMARLLPRTWSDASDSFKIEAQLVSRDGDAVTLKRSDNGKLATLPLSRLSDVDAEFAKTYGKPMP